MLTERSRFLKKLTAVFLVTAFLYFFTLHITASKVFLALGLFVIIVVSYVLGLIPYSILRFIVWILTHTLFRIKVIGRNNVPETGGVLFVSNHVSYLDVALLVVAVKRPIRFLVEREIYDLKIFKPLFQLANVIPLSSRDPSKKIIRALTEAQEALKTGEVVCMFAEGQFTRTGNILPFQKGFEHIMRGMDCPIIPIHLDRMWGSIFSYRGGKYYYRSPKLLPYPVTITFGTVMPAHSTAFKVRCRVLELSAEAFKYRLGYRMTLAEGFFREARRHPFKFCMADSTGKKLNCAQTFIAALVLTRRLRKRLRHQRHIGIMLPPSVGGALVNIALSILRKVVVNLNYTLSDDALKSICQQAQIKYVITSRKFLEKIEKAPVREAIFVEDCFQNIYTFEKMSALIRFFIWPKPLARRLCLGRRRKRYIEELATIIFTSGSTGEPKGVMLTHANIIANIEGLYQIIQVHEKDRVMGVLPFFHSFGFTTTLWLPLLSHFGIVYHMNPLDAPMVGDLIQKYKVTFLFTTPTFLNHYLRRCEKEQFKSLRVVITGAEKLKKSIADAFELKFGIPAMEGYGCTEVSPVVSFSFPDYSQEGILQRNYKPGKIGLTIPGVAVKICDRNTLKPLGPNEDGLLYVKGPNVMKGYLNHPEETQNAIQSGWYCTNDIANMDEDGFLMIMDRLSRFSKIGGEMVPHLKVEETIHSALGASEQICAVSSVPDERKGERLVVLYTGDLDPRKVVKKLIQQNLPKLWIPSQESFYKIDALPVLGSGKVNLGLVKQLALELVSHQ